MEALRGAQQLARYGFIVFSAALSHHAKTTKHVGVSFLSAAHEQRHCRLTQIAGRAELDAAYPLVDKQEAVAHPREYSIKRTFKEVQVHCSNESETMLQACLRPLHRFEANCTPLSRSDSFCDRCLAPQIPQQHSAVLQIDHGTICHEALLPTMRQQHYKPHVILEAQCKARAAIRAVIEH